ncbi:esterase/lipase family protein [Isoalcanivorax indicus]|uniref:esterase/lipase family protein n=1 Tax=Isoalcanivorax indicus TaxID=2202653 RepID=UPI000DB94741|nr:triacylglycerol lipase [Isoalcanivorax indicus]
MMDLITLLLTLLFTVTGLQTLAFYAIWYYERRTRPEEAKVPGETPVKVLPGMLGILVEWAAITFLVVTYPLRLLHDASPVRTRKRGEPPIILVHGYGGDSANFLLMQWRLKRRGWDNVYAVSYTPPTLNARKLAQQVADHVDRILAATGADKAYLICHSMGGPLTRYALQHLGLAGKVEKVISLGSPHRGSSIANLFPAMGAAAQMRYRSAFIQELEETAGPTPGGATFYSIYSNFDNFVLPSSTAVLGGEAQNIHVPYHGHCTLLYSNQVLAQVESCLREGPAEATPSRSPD